MLLKRLHLIKYIQCSISIFYMHWETKKGCDSLFVIFAVLQWSGTKPTVSLMYAYTILDGVNGKNIYKFCNIGSFCETGFTSLIQDIFF